MTSGSAIANSRKEQAQVELSTTRSRLESIRSIPILIRLCLVVLVIIGVAALFAPAVAPHDPARQDLRARLQPPLGFGGSFSHPFGTDQLGRDILSRVIYGARISLGIGVLGMVIGLTIGTTIGLVSGYNRGIADDLAMFLVDVQLALPVIIIALIAIAVFGTSLTVLILVLGIAYWESYARVTRSLTLSSSQSQYVLAAQALGATRSRILGKHILPNVIAPLIVLATFLLTLLILLETTLSFLGLGVQPPTASWGRMMSEGRSYLNTAWWLAVAPGVAIILTTMSISLIGDWLRDALDPSLRNQWLS